MNEKKLLHLEAVDGPDAADADLLRLMRWEARGKPATNFSPAHSLKISFRFIGGSHTNKTNEGMHCR